MRPTSTGSEPQIYRSGEILHVPLSLFFGGILVHGMCTYLFERPASSSRRTVEWVHMSATQLECFVFFRKPPWCSGTRRAGAPARKKRQNSSGHSARRGNAKPGKTHIFGRGHEAGGLVTRKDGGGAQRGAVVRHRAGVLPPGRQDKLAAGLAGSRLPRRPGRLLLRHRGGQGARARGRGVALPRLPLRRRPDRRHQLRGPSWRAEMGDPSSLCVRVCAQVSEFSPTQTAVKRLVWI